MLCINLRSLLNLFTKPDIPKAPFWARLVKLYTQRNLVLCHAHRHHGPTYGLYLDSRAALDVGKNNCLDHVKGDLLKEVHPGIRNRNTYKPKSNEQDLGHDRILSVIPS